MNVQNQRIECPVTECYRSGRPDNIRSHLRSVHRYNDEQIKDFNLALKTMKAKGGTLHVCKKCSHFCPTKDGLRTHIRKIHGGAETQEDILVEEEEASSGNSLVVVGKIESKQKKFEEGKRLPCPVEACTAIVSSRRTLVEHFHEKHSETSDEFVLEKIELKNEQEFDNWLSLRRESTCTTFAKTRTTQDGNLKTEYFVCSNEGDYQSVAKERKGHDTKKTTGEKHCTAYMKVDKNVSDGTHFVTCCFTHFGHSTNPAQQKMTPNQVNLIKSMIGEGFYNSQIIEKLQKEYGSNSRLHFLLADDLRSFRIQHDLIPGRLDADDLKSILKRCDLNNLEDGIRFFQRPTNDRCDGFRLAIMTPEQEQFLRKYSHRAVIIDDTHNVTQYNLKLTTVVIVTLADRGFPAGITDYSHYLYPTDRCGGLNFAMAKLNSAFLLSSSTTTDDVACLFKVIKDVHPSFAPKHFMSDEAYTFYNAFISVFPEREGLTQKLLCRWHIFRTWKKNADIHLRELTKQHVSAVLGVMNRMLKTPSLIELQTTTLELYSLLNNIGSPGATRFAEYFEKNYAGKAKQWATALRDFPVANTSMFAENWHSTLKSEFLGKKNNIRCDHLLYVLFEGLQTIMRRREIEKERGLAKANPRKGQQRKNHRTAVENINDYDISCDRNKVILTFREDSDRQYTVTDLGVCDCDSEENTHCDHCTACYYRYTCTCLDQRAGWSCKHIHMAIITIQNKDDNREEEPFFRPDDVEVENNLVPDLLFLDEQPSNHIKSAKTKDEKSAKLTAITNMNNMNEEILRKMAKTDNADDLSIFDKVLSLVKEANDILKSCNVQRSGLVARSDVQRSRGAKRPTARETMDFKIQPKNKFKKLHQKMYEDDRTSVSYANGELTVCSHCKKDVSPFGASSSGEKFKYCPCCDVPAHQQCIEMRNNDSMCIVCEIGEF